MGSILWSRISKVYYALSPEASAEIGLGEIARHDRHAGREGLGRDAARVPGEAPLHAQHARCGVGRADEADDVRTRRVEQLGEDERSVESRRAR